MESAVHKEESMALKVLFVAVEGAPFAKVGGLADVVGALPAALRRKNVDARIVLPDYAMIRQSGKYRTRLLTAGEAVFINSHWPKPVSVWLVEDFDVPVYLIGTDEWFQDADKSESIYRVGIDQYLFFSQAVLALSSFVDWQPDVIHCHDWHTGFIPVLMREQKNSLFEETASVYTIHNLAYQGEFEQDILDKLGLPQLLFNSHQVEAWGRVNFLKSGVAYADRVTTVSETYSHEIQTPTYGCALDGLMQFLNREHRLSGILNGIDIEIFNPEVDPDIAEPFSYENLQGKSKCRLDLFNELAWAPKPNVPLFGMVSRISGQKGHRLVIDAAEKLDQLGIQVVILGSGEPPLVEALHHVANQFPSTFRFVEGYEEKLAPKIYAGCDGFLMPSIFEPCGLGQMISMRYGTVPIARMTGGLADTVFEGINGFTFNAPDSDDLLAAISRFKSAFANKKLFKKIQRNGMLSDFSWDISAEKYIQIYEEAVSSKREVSISA